MLLASLISAVVLLCALFSGLILLSGDNVPYQFVLPVYFLIIGPLSALLWRITGESETRRKTGLNKLPLNLLFIIIPVAEAVLAGVNSGLFVQINQGRILASTSYLSTVILAFHILSLVYALFLLENIYRFALTYQRRLGWVTFAGFLVLIFHQIVFSTRWLLYGWVPASWFEFAAFLYLPLICAVPWSFVRYRTGAEKIRVTRDAVYSSFSLLIIGALFTALGLTSTVLRAFNIKLSAFDFKVLGVSVLFAGTILAGSARMRRRVAKLVNRRLYTNRYDYRSQFFSLHRILGRVEGYNETLEELLEHLRLSLNADHAYIFTANEQNGNFELVSPKERELPGTAVIKAGSPLIATLQRKGDYFGLLRTGDEPSMKIETETPEEIAKLDITSVAPVLHHQSLLAVLALRCKGTEFDIEDTSIIESYASVIADFLFKHRILRERLEQKQFESFSHMASFIVHDVKNQVATLKLLLRNAEQNISDPKFQESLMVSLRSCTKNLGDLVSKLSMPPRRDRIKNVNAEIEPVISRLIDETGLQNHSSIALHKEIVPGVYAVFDESALFYTVKNLVVNALESMEGKEGRLSIKVMPVSSSLDWLTTWFSGNEKLFSEFSAVIAVEDTGYGMSEDFIRNRLFRPFSTTKDKGIGIGLYQCKTLVEEMGGKILCSSQVSGGTLFCILLR